MDTVWLKLTVIKENDITQSIAIEQSFMFGPGGITRFATVNKRTVLYESKQQVATVMETNAYIMTALQSVRNPERSESDKQREESNSKRKTPKAKASLPV